MSRPFLILLTLMLGFCWGAETKADVGYCSSRCYDNGNAAVFIGAGFDYLPLLQFSSPRNARYQGMGGAADIGFDIPSSATFGYRIVVEGGYLNLTNKANSDTVSELGSKQNIGGRLALVFGGLSFGLGGRYSNIEIRQISQNTAPVKQSYNATSGVIALGYSLRSGDRLGVTVNSQYEKSITGTASFHAISLQLLLHFSLLVR